jgi:hypothetical protein
MSPTSLPAPFAAIQKLTAAPVVFRSMRTARTVLRCTFGSRSNMDLATSPMMFPVMVTFLPLVMEMP